MTAAPVRAVDIHALECTLRNNNNKGSDRFALLFVVNTVVRTLTVGLLMAERDGGSARRRRERRLCSFLRHERMTVRMELAAALHHSCGGGLGTHEGLRAQKTASAGLAEYFELSSDDGRPAGGERPAALLEPRPQERDRRHTGVGCEIAQNLEVPVPQMGEQQPNVLQFFASFLPGVAEPVIEVPKILLDRTPQRLGDRLRQPQMVEQLVHVLTVVSYSSLQQLTAEQIVDIPVPGRGGLQGSRPGQGSTASSSHGGAADGAGQWFFSHFSPTEKKCGARGRN